MQKVIVCVFENKGKLLLEKRWDNEDNYAGLWTFPMGHVEFLETRKHAVKREMSEELKIKIRSKDLMFLGKFLDKDPTSKKDYLFYVYLCEKYTGKIRKSYEQEKISWLNLENIQKKKSAIVKKIISMLKGSKKAKSQ